MFNNWGWSLWASRALIMGVELVGKQGFNNGGGACGQAGL